MVSDDRTNGPENATGRLLAVDVGLRTGLALFGAGGRVLWYRSHNLGSVVRLRRAASRIIEEAGNLSHLVLEGGGHLARVWMKEAERHQLPVLLASAEAWRSCLLLPREQRDRRTAKDSSQDYARRVIIWSGLPRPVRLRHDAAEAVLAGLWAARELGLLNAWPRELRA